jgi:DNA (cytosine-5)-methyltransferase 1
MSRLTPAREARGDRPIQDPAMTLRIGSLCTGYGGLDTAVQEVFGGELAWVADNDPGAGKILACRYPAIRNVGDITAADWSGTDPVDLVCGGYPCQPDSDAGPRRGVEDERFIWPSIADGLLKLRPAAVVFENVPGHLGRGFPRVLADLAWLGYDVRWVTVRASDVGAPHKRARVFIYGQLGAMPVPPGAQVVGVLEGGAWRKPQESLFGAVPLTKMPPAGELASGMVWARDPAAPATAPWDLLPTPAARDWRSGQSNIMDRNARPLNEVIENLPLLKTPTAQLAVNGGSQDPAKRRAGGHGPTLADQLETMPADGTTVDLGEYEPAVRRWEQIFRPAPAPTAPGRGGKPRLSPAFPEWMMGLPAGHVTDVPGLTRKEQLHAIGNGVVRRQAAMALRILLGAIEAGEAA